MTPIADSTAPTEIKPAKAKPAPVAWMAIVEKFAGPNETRPIDVVEADNKRELRKKLADPSIAAVSSILRGRKLVFTEKRNVAF